MPTYVYEREDGSLFEKYQSMKDEPLKKCPRTGQSCKRMISGGLDTGSTFSKGHRTSVTHKKNELGDLGTSLSDYSSIQSRQRQRFEEKKKERKKKKTTTNH